MNTGEGLQDGEGKPLATEAYTPTPLTEGELESSQPAFDEFSSDSMSGSDLSSNSNSGSNTEQSDLHPLTKGSVAMSGDLPMLVNLSEEDAWAERYGDEFVLDADQVMAQLKIKRSRLTQISGRELRVGRRREGRYIKPYYRKQDVQDYIGWSRAPATQVRGAQAFDHVWQKLHGELGRWKAELGDELVERVEQTHPVDTTEAGIERSLNQLRLSFAQLNTHLWQDEARSQLREQNVRRLLGDVLQQLQEMHDAFHKQASVDSSLLSSQEHLRASMHSLHARFETWESRVADWAGEFGEEWKDEQKKRLAMDGELATRLEGIAERMDQIDRKRTDRQTTRQSRSASNNTPQSHLSRVAQLRASQEQFEATSTPLQHTRSLIMKQARHQKSSTRSTRPG